MFLALCILSAPTSPAAGPPQERDELRPVLERLARAALDDGAQGLTLAIEAHGEIFYAGAWGACDARGTRASPGSSLGAGPLLGTFLDVAALRLAERGALDLDAPLAQLLPGLYPGQREITLDRLLTHTSGIPAYGDILAAHGPRPGTFSTAAILAWLTDAPLDSSPGSCASYSDTNELLLGLALEKAAGKPVRELLAYEVFGPAGMQDTGWIDEPSERHASAHLDQEFGSGEVELVNASPPFEADELHSTVLDLARFERALAAGKLLGTAMLERRTEPARLEGGVRAACARGVNLTALDDLPRLTAGGAMAGERVHLARYPTMDATIALMARGPDAPLDSLERSLARALFERQPRDARDLPLSAAERAVYVGDYYAGCTSYGITESGERLVLLLPSGERHELLNQGEARFLARDDPDLSLEFELVDGRALALVLTEHGVPLRARRVS